MGRASMTVARVTAVAAAIACALAAIPATAEEAATPPSPGGRAIPVAMPRQARLLLPTCATPPFVTADLVSMLRVELLGYGTELDPVLTAEAAAEGVAIVTVDSPYCDSSDVRVRVVHSATDQSAAQQFDFTDTPGEDLARTLALAIAEFLGAMWSDLGGRQPAQVEPGPPEPAAPRPAFDGDALRRGAVGDLMRELNRRRRKAAYVPPRLLLDLRLGMQVFPFNKGAIFGGDAGLSLLLSRSVPLRLAVDVAYGYGEGASARGELKDHVVLGGVALLFEGGNGIVRGSLGPRLEIGWGRVTGTPRTDAYDTGEAEGLLLEVLLDVGLRVALGRRVSILANAIVGYVLVGLETTSGGDSLAGIAGAALGLDLGIAVAL